MPGSQLVWNGAGRIDWSIELPLPQTLGIPPPPQVSVPLQLPHWSVVPQPSLIAPQFFPCAAQVVGVQVLAPQTLGVPPPPQVSPAPHEPHWSVAPQPSLMVPQFLPWAAQVVGVQVPAPQTLGVPPPPQVWPEPQVPQLSVRCSRRGRSRSSCPAARGDRGAGLGTAVGSL